MRTVSFGRTRGILGTNGPCVPTRASKGSPCFWELVGSGGNPQSWL